MDKKHPIAALIILTSLIIVSTAGVSANHIPGKKWDNESDYRVFYSDDKDSLELAFNSSGDTPSWVNETDEDDLQNLMSKQLGEVGGSGEYSDKPNESLNSIAKKIDLYYLNSSPQVKVNGDTFREYRKETFQVNTSRNTSIWPGHTDLKSETFVDKRSGGSKAKIFIKDAYAKYIGFKGGILNPFMVNCRFFNSDCTNPTLIPEKGKMYNLADYRVILPNEHGNTAPKKDINKEYCRRKPHDTYFLCLFQRWEYSYEIVNRDPIVEMTAGNKTFNNNGSPLETPYRNLSDDVDKIQIDSLVGITLERTTDYLEKSCYLKPGNEIECETETDKWSSNISARIPFSEEVSIKNPSDKKMSIEQQRIGDSLTILKFNGPNNTRERRLWSTIHFEDFPAGIKNVWKTFSLNQTKELGGFSNNTNENGGSYYYPNTPYMALGVRGAYPEMWINWNDIDPKNYSSDPKLLIDDPVTTLDERERLHENVNLAYGEANIYDKLVIKNPPANISVVKDIFGNKIPINTVNYQRKNVSITPVHRGNNSLLVRLTDEEGDPLYGHKVEVRGVKDYSTKTVNRSGFIELEPSGSTVQITHVRNISEDNRLFYPETEKSISWRPSVDFSALNVSSVFVDVFLTVRYWWPILLLLGGWKLIKAD